jgi:hypothetical protein
VTPPTLAEKLLALHQTLDRAGIAHAFGGAIALAYCTGEPRGTIDIDLNVFVGPSEARRVFDTLPVGVVTDDVDVTTVDRDGQVRVFWDNTPVDLFFAYHQFHEEVARRVVVVPFVDERIPVLACEDLLVFKAFFARTKDWADIEAMMASGTLDSTTALQRVATLLGADHATYLRLVRTAETAPDI